MIRWRHFDWLLLLAVIGLVSFGLVNVASTAWDPVDERFRGYLTRQIFYAVIGLGVFLCAHLVSYQHLERWAYPLYGLGLVLLFTVFFMPARQGARRWITIGPIPFQPSEAMKLFVILALARTLKHLRSTDRLTDLAPVLVLTGIPLLMIAKQPDLGTSLTLLPTMLAMLFVAGARSRHLGQLMLAGALMIPIGLLFLKPYQKERLNTWLSHGSLTRQQQLDQAYQSIQAEIAVGSGGVFGKGWRQGTQNSHGFVPDRHNDFIFCVICEEWGLLGAVLLLAAFALLLSCLLGVVGAVREPFGQLLAVGVATMIATQVVMHCAINVQLFPVTGLTLPLISSGGTSLVSMLFAVGLVSNVRLWSPATLG